MKGILPKWFVRVRKCDTWSCLVRESGTAAQKETFGVLAWLQTQPKAVRHDLMYRHGTQSISLRPQPFCRALGTSRAECASNIVNRCAHFRQNVWSI
jgi:hypothetical protein